jgi:antitoxin ParD1/3/4
MNILLPADLELFVEKQVSLGAYSTPSDVVGDALRLLRLHDRERQALVEDLRTKVAAGVEQLDHGDLVPSEEVFAELRERNARVQPNVRP